MTTKQQWTEYELGELLSYEQPTPYIVNSTDYNDKYTTPVLTAGKSFVLGYTNETSGIHDALPVIIFDDFTTASRYVNFPFKVKSSALKILTPNTMLVLPRFIYYRMQIIQFDCSTHKRYWIQQYSKIKVAIPPIPEQARIVTRIEELFSELDSGVETLKTVKAQLEVYRQAVLQKAFNGDLTNSKWLKFDALGSYIEKPRYGTSKKCSYSRDKNSTAVYRIPNIDYEIGGIDHSDIKYATFTDAELQELQLENEDILIIRSNGSVSLVGRAAMIEKADIDGTFAGYLMRLRIKDKSVLCPQFLLLYLQSHKARTYIESKAKSTSGVNNINSGEICALPIPLFKYDEQQKIIESIEARLSVCNNIKKVVNTALQQAEAMRQSILKDTFEGSLQ